MSAPASILAEEIAADPAFDFAADPAKAVGHASMTAAQADLERRKDSASLWTHVACALIVLADNPNVVRGEVLTNLVGRYGDGL